MKKLLIVTMSLALLMTPLAVYSQSEQRSVGAPPVSQTLVPEGQFALKLATALKLGTPKNEAQAEDMLTSAGIAPKNGWIADYPMTPNVIGELQSTVTAADAKKLPMGKDEALKAFQSLTAEVGVAVSPGSDQYAESQPPTSSEYVPSEQINDYYYDEGPPVVTYYPPPWDYNYLYAWVPYPFWCTGFFFPGFFVLNDFDIIVVGHHHDHFRVSNHFFNAGTHAFGRVDPVNHAWTKGLHTTAFHSTVSRNAASSIFSRSMGRTTFARGNQRMTGNRASSFGTNQGRALGNGVGGGRSLHSFNRSFNTPSGRGSSSSGRSFSGSSSGHSFGGFSGGHSFGGFSGGFHGGGGGRR